MGASGHGYPAGDHGRGRTALLCVGLLLLAIPEPWLPGVVQAAAVPWLVAAALAGRRELSRAEWPGALLLALAVLSIGWSVDAGQSVVVAAGWVGFAGLVLASRAGDVHAMATTAAVVVALCAAQALRQVWVLYDDIPALVAAAPEARQVFAEEWAQRRRATGPFASPDILAGFLLPLVPAAWSLSQRPGPSQWLRWAAAFSSVAGLGALLLTRSMGGATAAGLALAVTLLPRLWRAHRVHALLVGAAAAAAPLLVLWSRGGWNAAARPTSSAWDRFSDWANAAAMLGRIPAWGVGAGAYESAFNALSPPGRRYAAYVHDAPLQLAVELGLAGLVLAVAFYGVVMVWAVKRARQAATSAEALQAAGVLAAAAHHLLDYDLHVAGGAGLFVGVAMLRGARVPDDAPVALPPVRLALGMACVAVAWVGAGMALTERGLPRLPSDEPDLLLDARGLALLSFDARAHASVAEDAWLVARRTAAAGGDAAALWDDVERLGARAARLAPWLPAGPMVLARSRVERGDGVGALDAYNEAARRACCSWTLRSERRALAHALGREELVREDDAWLERARADRGAQ